MNDIQDELLHAFQEEHKEQLKGIRAILLEMERSGGHVTEGDLEEAFRLAHSLKAAARVCDLAPIDELGSNLETTFSRVIHGTLTLDREVVGVIHLVLDSVEKWAACLVNKGNPPDLTGARQAVAQVLRKEMTASGAPPIPRPALPTIPLSSLEKMPPSSEMDDLSQQLLAAFQIEHKEHLEGIRSILGEGDKGISGNTANLEEAFRRAHSLKGAARLAGLKKQEKIAHQLETLFARVREGTLHLDSEVIGAIQLGLDAIEDGAVCLLENRPSPEPTRAFETIARILGLGAPSRQSMSASKTPAEPVPEHSPLVATAETVRVSAENLDGLLRSTGQLLTETLRQNLLGHELAGLRRQVKEVEHEWESLRNSAAGSLRQLADTPGFGRIARFLNLVEHNVRALSRQARSVSLLQQRSAWTLRLLGGKLQQDVRRVRMVSAESVFQGFRKMMRDLAREEGKEIEFRVSGFEILADRVVLQVLKDPLMHILCNAVSHGIETPEERQAQGKNIVGRVTLQLEAPGNRLKILVEDDGRGINSGKVADVAVERGYLSEEEKATATPEELARLIFRPGFTTASQVTGLSGRGMGLSVVHEATRRLQGEVTLLSRDGPGTAIFLAVPLSISTQRLLLVSCHGQTFALSIHGIERLLRITLKDVEMVEGKPMLLFQGQPIPIVSLAFLLGMGVGEVHFAVNSLPLMVVRSGTRRVAIAVDGLLEERDALIKDLDSPASLIGKLAGGILLEDGSVCLVLNLTELINTNRTADRAPSLKRVDPAPQKKARSTVLVVDDSLTTRTLEKSILEAHGYNVRIAMDGVEALNQLRSETPDLVITDVQMPRMDGFTLLEEMKKDQRLAKVPVIVVTSMEKREDQERGLALGADAYIVKRKFDHQDLLEKIQQIL